MNILYINHYAGSPKMGMEFRPYYLSREWIKQGHHVTIIAADFSHLRKINPKTSTDFEEEYIDGICYLWLKTGTYTGNGISRAKTMFRFVHKIRQYANEIYQKYKPDIVITSSTYPLDTYAGQKIKKLNKNIVLIHEVHDMWPLTLYEIGGMSKFNPFAQIMQISENSFCKHSDYVCSLLPYAKEYLMEHGMREEKFFSVTNGIVEEEWEHSEKLPQDLQNLLDDLHRENRFIIGFFGSHTKSYNLDYLIEAIPECKQDIVAVFVGRGNYKNDLINLAQKTEAEVYFYDPIPKNAIPTFISNVDVSYVSAVDNSMFKYGISMNKLFDAMMGGKPILYAVNAPNNYIVDYQCGISIKPADKKALVEGINFLSEMTENDRLQMGMNGKKAVGENFTYKILARKFIDKIHIK